MADAVAELGLALARLGLASIEGLSDSNLDDPDTARALDLHLDALGRSELLQSLALALALVEKVRSAAGAADAPTLVWNALQEHAVDPRAVSALAYHLTKVQVAARCAAVKAAHSARSR